MSLEVTGKLLAKYDTQQVSDKFKKREFVLELAEEINGNIYTNFAKFQAVQNKCEILDRFREGEQLKVTFNIKGNSYVDRKDGLTKYITNLDAWRIESASAQPVGGGQPAQQHQPSTYATQAPSAPSNEGVDDLPF